MTTDTDFFDEDEYDDEDILHDDEDEDFDDPENDDMDCSPEDEDIESCDGCGLVQKQQNCMQCGVIVYCECDPCDCNPTR